MADIGEDSNKECTICLDGDGDLKTKYDEWVHVKCLEESKRGKRRKENDEGVDCSICLDTGCDLKTECNHWFHSECLKGWKNGKDKYSCPNCRYELREVIIVEKDANGKTMYVPLMFWFNTYPQLAVPIVAIPYNERFINVDFADMKDLVDAKDPGDIDALVSIPHPFPPSLPPLIMPFALYPDSYQPTGCLNVSNSHLHRHIPVDGSAYQRAIDSKYLIKDKD